MPRPPERPALRVPTCRIPSALFVEALDVLACVVEIEQKPDRRADPCVPHAREDRRTEGRAAPMLIDRLDDGREKLQDVVYLVLRMSHSNPASRAPMTATDPGMPPMSTQPMVLIVFMSLATLPITPSGRNASFTMPMSFLRSSWSSAARSCRSLRTATRAAVSASSQSSSHSAGVEPLRPMCPQVNASGSTMMLEGSAAAPVPVEIHRNW